MYSQGTAGVGVGRLPGLRTALGSDGTGDGRDLWRDNQWGTTPDAGQTALEGTAHG